MNSLIAIQSQIEKLQKQAGEIKTREFDKAVQEVLSKMAAFGITVKDLKPTKTRTLKITARTSAGKRTPAKVKKTSHVAIVAAKYRGPNEETWSGRGLTPRWLSALLAQGRTKDEFAVKN